MGNSKISTLTLNYGTIITASRDILGGGYSANQSFDRNDDEGIRSGMKMSFMLWRRIYEYRNTIDTARFLGVVTK